MTTRPILFSPRRIQRKRTKGWRMPESAVYVGRPTIWGNPHRVEIIGAELAVKMFRRDIEAGIAGWPGIRKPLTVEMIREQLRGKDLACWCALDQPCHADVLLELANTTQTERA